MVKHCAWLPNIGRKIYTWTNAPINKHKFGEELGYMLATKLWANQTKNHAKDCFGIIHLHRDYGGHGLAWAKLSNSDDVSSLILSEVHDGYLNQHTFCLKWSTEQQKDFVLWAGHQSDFSLSGFDESSAALYTPDRFKQNNQRITEQRIRDFLADRAQ